MAFQPEQPNYDAGVYQIESTDPVDGGVGSITNSPLLNLADRTAYLYQHVTNLENGTTLPPGIAPLNSPGFTGTPTAPTAPAGDNSTRLANTAWVQGLVNGLSTINCAGNANIVLTAVQTGVGVLELTGALTGNISVIVPGYNGKWVVTNQTTGAYTITVKTPTGSGVPVTQGASTILWSDGVNVYDAKTDFQNTALTGNPTAPTQPSGDDSTKVANTAFVFSATDGLSSVVVAGNANVALTQPQYGSAILNLTGALTGSISLLFPAQTGQWVVANNSTGAYAITAKTVASGSTGITLPQGSAVVVYSDGTNIYFASSTSGQASFTPTSLTPATGTTTLTIPTGYTPGNLLVEKNGAWLIDGVDYTATDGANIDLVAATSAGDKISVFAFKTFTVANAVLKSGGAMTGPLALAGGDTGVTPSAGDNSAKLATTEFVTTLYNTSTGVTAGTYGDAEHVVTLTVDAAGRITAAGTAGINVPLALGYIPVNKAGDTMSGTLNISGPKNPINVTSASAYDTYVSITNTSTNGRSWAIGSAGTTPPTGLAAGDFFVYDETAGGWCFRIDSAGKSHFLVRPDFNGNVPWDTENLTPLDVNNGGTVHAELIISTPAGSPGVLTLTSADTSNTYMVIANTSPGAAQWAIGTAGATSPPNGTAAADFFLYNYNLSKTVFRIDNAAGQAHFAVRPDFNGATPWDSRNFTPGNYLLLTGGTLTGNLTLNGAQLFLNSATPADRYVNTFTNGVGRWRFGANSTAESGSNSGTDWDLTAFDDTGAYLSTPIHAARSSGQVTFGVRPVFNGATPWDTSNLTPLDRNTGGTVNAPVTINGGSNPIPLSLTSASASDTYIDLTNTSTGGRSWAVGTSGQTAPTGTSTGDFFLWDLTGNAWRQRIDSSGNFYFSGNLTSYGTSVNFNSTSDERVKTNLVAAEPQCIHREWFGEYDRTDREAHGRGVLAQGVRRHMPMYVVEDASVKVPGTNEPLLGVAHAAVALEQSIWCGRKIDKIIAALAAAGIEVD